MLTYFHVNLRESIFNRTILLCFIEEQALHTLSFSDVSDQMNIQTNKNLGLMSVCLMGKCWSCLTNGLNHHCSFWSGNVLICSSLLPFPNREVIISTLVISLWGHELLCCRMGTTQTWQCVMNIAQCVYKICWQLFEALYYKGFYYMLHHCNP